MHLSDPTFSSFHSFTKSIKTTILGCGFRDFFDFVEEIKKILNRNLQDVVFSTMMSSVQEDKQEKYRKKYKYMKIRIKSLILVN